MATAEQIAARDRLIQQIVTQFDRGLIPLFVQLFDQIAVQNTVDRIQLAQLFQPLRQYAQQQIQILDQIVSQNLDLHRSVLEPQLDPISGQAVQQLSQEAAVVLAAQIDAEANTIINTIVLAGIAGGITASVLRSLRSNSKRARSRLSLAFETSLRQFDGALTLVRSTNSPNPVRYRYVGGVIAESRDFCRSLNGRTLTEQEIRQIWSSQTWSGKQTGDPFVTRGGYNCRHSFVPVGEDRASS